jgi:hypothetical protein
MMMRTPLFLIPLMVLIAFAILPSGICAPVLSPVHRDFEDRWTSSEEFVVSRQQMSAAGGVYTIRRPGTYRLSGDLGQGRVVVESEGQAPVRILLSGVRLASALGAPIEVVKASGVVLTLMEGPASTLLALPAVSGGDAPKAVIQSRAPLAISGKGALVVEGRAQDGINVTDGLLIQSGSLTVMAGDEGIRGKDYLVVRSGDIRITSGGDGMKSDHAKDTTKGYVAIYNGNISITSGGDAVSARTDLEVRSGKFQIVAGGGSSRQLPDSLSAKGLKAGRKLMIHGGQWDVSAADDALHSGNQMVIEGGEMVLATGDDALHADSLLLVQAGNISILRSYEGLEASVIDIRSGTVSVVSSDDGINPASGGSGEGPGGPGFPEGMGGPGFPRGPGGPGFPGGMGGRGERASRGDGGGRMGNPEMQGSGMMGPGMMPGGPGMMFGGMPGGPGMMGGGRMGFPGGFGGNNTLYIRGGNVVVQAGGDGIDVNGSVEMTGGRLVVHGPTFQGNGALDYDGTFRISGGIVVAAGSAGMAQAPGDGSTQPSVFMWFASPLAPGVVLQIREKGGSEVLTFSPLKNAQTLVVSSPLLKMNAVYEVYSGGKHSGAVASGLWERGNYSGGKKISEFTVTSLVTRVSCQ